MASRVFRNIRTPGNGIIALPFSFASGAAEDASFPLGADGYEANEHFIDGYGKGYTVVRTTVGTYHLILADKYDKILHVDVNAELVSQKLIQVVPVAPLKQSENGTSPEDPGREGNRIILWVLNASAVREDLVYNERISGVVWLDNSGV